MREEMNAPILRARSLTKNFGQTPALQNLNLDIYPGQVVGLLGENGCGKTTLMKIFAGVLQGYQGEVEIAGMKPGPETKALVAFLPDESFFPSNLTIDGCLDLFQDFFADFDAKHAEDLLTLFTLPRDKKLREMSKGMREKVQVAMLMGRRAKVYLLDEPISGVDPAARDILLRAITMDLEPDSLIVISTHLIHDLEPILDSVVMMRYGQILVNAPVDALREQHGKSIDELFREVYR